MCVGGGGGGECPFWTLNIKLTEIQHPYYCYLILIKYSSNIDNYQLIVQTIGNIEKKTRRFIFLSALCQNVTTDITPKQ